jgi:hypothetical protein
MILYITKNGALITALAQKVVGPTNTSKFYFCKP